MNKSIKLIIALGVVMMAASSCKTKQKIAEIPAGANIEAKAPENVGTPSSSTQAQSISEVNDPEVTRNENFSLANGETNSDALNYKYHVVVGSFKNQSNAQGLQKTLKSEGNNAVVVVNQQGMFRVLIASFNDYKQAHVRINSIASRFPDAWVLVKK